MQDADGSWKRAEDAAARRSLDARLAAARAAEERAIPVMAAQAEKRAQETCWKERLSKAREKACEAYHSLQEARNVVREAKEKLRRAQQQLTLGRLGDPMLQAELEKEVEQGKERVATLEAAEKEYKDQLAEARQLVNEAKKALGLD